MTNATTGRWEGIMLTLPTYDVPHAYVHDVAKIKEAMNQMSPSFTASDLDIMRAWATYSWLKNASLWWYIEPGQFAWAAAAVVETLRKMGCNEEVIQ